MGAALKINWSEYNQQSTNSSFIKNNIKNVVRKNNYEKIINLDLSNKNLKVNSVTTNQVVKNQIKSTRISKKDVYTLTIYNKDMEPVYKIGLGNPFEVRVQHIGFEETDNFMFDTPIKNYSVAIPMNIDASFVSINKRTSDNQYNIVSLKAL